MKVRCLGVAASILSVLAATSAATADNVEHPECALILHQERVELEEWKLAVNLAVSRSAAAESIFALVDELWKDDLIEQFFHLTTDQRRSGSPRR